MYKHEVCPNPPNSTSDFATSIDSLNDFVLYIPKIGDNFSCANSSFSVASLTSAISILAFSGTSKPANFAILYALCPTISGFNAPAIPGFE